MSVAAQGATNESQVAEGRIEAASRSVPQSIKCLSVHVMLSLQVMVLGGSHTDVRANVSRDRRSKRCQVTAFDHYSNGGGTWVCLCCFL